MTPVARRALASLSDRELIVETQRLADRERHATADVIAALMEFDERRLYLGEGCSSLFTYCTSVLRFSEHAAYGRIEAARAARRFPMILDMLANGELTLTAVNLLSAQLTLENHAEVLEAARYKSKREVEVLLSALRPRPDVPTAVRKVPVRPPTVSLPEASAASAAQLSPRPPAVPGPMAPSPTRPPVIAPLTPERYKLQVTISREAHDLLRRAQDLLRHAVPGGDAAEVVERAFAVLVQDLERKKLGAARHPRTAPDQRTRSRHVPAAVRREVWRRDEGRCAFVGNTGRCVERGFLELHHVVPFADCGATDAANVQLRCRAHNQYEAEQWFGPLVVRASSALYVGTSAGPSGWEST